MKATTKLYQSHPIYSKFDMDYRTLNLFIRKLSKLAIDDNCTYFYDTVSSTHYNRIKRCHRLKHNSRDNTIEYAEVSRLIKNSPKECYWCHTHLNDLPFHIDHYVPVSKGGPHVIQNLRISCPSCNLRKNNKDPVEFGELIGNPQDPLIRDNILSEHSIINVSSYYRNLQETKTKNLYIKILRLQCFDSYLLLSNKFHPPIIEAVSNKVERNYAHYYKGSNTCKYKGVVLRQRFTKDVVQYLLNNGIHTLQYIGFDAPVKWGKRSLDLGHPIYLGRCSHF